MPEPRTPPPGAPLSMRLLRRVLAALASLQLAIVLLALFAIALAGATVLESDYGARVAQTLVYRAWWFTGLLVLLAINVLGAALKKYPWRRYQTGFLVTHAGLLMLLGGGLLTSLFGIEGQMVLVDTAERDLQARLGLSDTAESIHLDGVQQLNVLRLRRPREGADERLLRLVRILDAGRPVPDDLRDTLGGEWSMPLAPGVFTWQTDNLGTRRLPWSLDFLDRLACPWPGLTIPLDENVTLSVRNFYPRVEEDPHGRLGFVPRDGGPGRDAGGESSGLRCTLASAGTTEEFGVILYGRAARVWVGDEFYLVRYRPSVQRVPFTLTLRRAWQVKDPGSDRAAGFQSDVTVAGSDGRSSAPEEHSVSMNRTLGRGVYRVYQANYRRLTGPTADPVLAAGRPVSLSGLAVAYDPGLWLKYAGSLTVTAGIAIMFWMRAYFFPPRRRAQPAE